MSLTKSESVGVKAVIDGVNNGNRSSDRFDISYAEETESCDWGKRCKTPGWCEKFNRIEWVMVFWCLASFFQGAITSGMLPAVITTLEQRYLLTSTQIGVIVASYDGITVCVVTIVSYYGGRGRKPRWVGSGTFLLGVGCLLFSLPQLAFGPYTYASPGAPTCSSFSPNQTMNASASSNSSCSSDVLQSNSFWLFFVSQIISGIGGSPLFTIGITYLDENVKPGSSPLLIGSFFAMSVVGPAIGFLVTGACLSVYVDLSAPTADMTQDNQLWIGAWWIPFLSSGTFVILFVWFPMLGFPKRLPVNVRQEAESASETVSAAASQAEIVSSADRSSAPSNPLLTQPLGTDCGSICRSFGIVVRNSTVWLVSFSNAATFFLVAVFTTFGPKFIQVRFGQDASSASLYFGAVIVPGASIGTFIGGVIVKQMKFTVKNMLYFCVACTAISIPLAFIFFMNCQSAPFAGLVDTYPYAPNISYSSSPSTNSTFSYYSWSSPVSLSTVPSLSSPCNAHCSCSMTVYEPICGSDGVEYYSACFAGCSSFTRATDGTKLYYSCSCIQPPSSQLGSIYGSSSYSSTNSTSFATVSTCAASSNSPCLLPLFLVLLFVIAFVLFSTAVPSLQLLIRLTPPETNAVSLALNSIIYRLFGTIPGPIVAGALIDSCCSVWQQVGCSAEPACLAYDATKFEVVICILAGVITSIQLVFFVAAVLTYKPSETTTSETVVVSNDNAIELDRRPGGSNDA